jgi:hypothetical protein
VGRRPPRPPSQAVTLRCHLSWRRYQAGPPDEGCSDSSDGADRSDCSSSMTDGRATSEMRMTASGRFDPLLRFERLPGASRGCHQSSRTLCQEPSPTVARSRCIRVIRRIRTPLRHSSQP